jgi:hypothetical protein
MEVSRFLSADRVSRLASLGETLEGRWIDVCIDFSRDLVTTQFFSGPSPFQHVLLSCDFMPMIAVAAAHDSVHSSFE